jgi:hypothetical protein
MSSTICRPEGGAIERGRSSTTPSPRSTTSTRMRAGARPSLRLATSSPRVLSLLAEISERRPSVWVQNCVLPANRPAWLATHRAARRLPVHDDAVAAASAAVLGPLAPPASPRHDQAALDLGVLGLAQQGDQLRIALAQIDDRHLIAVDEGNGCGLRCQRNHPVSLLFWPSGPDRVRRRRSALQSSECPRSVTASSLGAEPPSTDSP